jgi:hypothetical protein
MPRKKRIDAELATQNTEATAPTVQALVEETSSMSMNRPNWIDGAATTSNGEIISTDPNGQDADSENETPSKNCGRPYKAIFTCSTKGFEMGENRRFKQRVFKFKDKPDEATLAALKENGFTLPV